MQLTGEELIALGKYSNIYIIYFYNKHWTKHTRCYVNINHTLNSKLKSLAKYFILLIKSEIKLTPFAKS